jgi:hypothetical protein
MLTVVNYICVLFDEFLAFVILIHFFFFIIIILVDIALGFKNDIAVCFHIHTVHRDIIKVFLFTN